jgi:predicted RNase H-like nuclease (RuvC/YqgF family)
MFDHNMGLYLVRDRKTARVMYIGKQDDCEQFIINYDPKKDKGIMNKKTKKIDALLTQERYYQQQLQKLISENYRLKSELNQKEPINIDLLRENKTLKKQNAELVVKSEEYNALLELLEDYKEHNIKQRIKINQLTEKLNEPKNTLPYRGEP